jgi:short-subunit dehydrogenase
MMLSQAFVMQYTDSVGSAMIRQKSGRIINLSSQAGFVAIDENRISCN